MEIDDDDDDDDSDDDDGDGHDDNNEEDGILDLLCIVVYYRIVFCIDLSVVWFGFRCVFVFDVVSRCMCGCIMLFVLVLFLYNYGLHLICYVMLCYVVLFISVTIQWRHYYSCMYMWSVYSFTQLHFLPFVGFPLLLHL